MCSTLTTLDSFLPFFATTDTKMKLSIGAKLYTYLGDPSNSMECSDIGQLMDMLALWLQSCNFKVAQLSLEILIELVERMRVDFQAYLPTILPYMVDKLGDSKEVIREKTLFLLMKLMECQVTNAQYLLDKIAVSAFSHKNSNVREQMMVFLTVLLDEYGPSFVSISKLVPHIVKLLSDPNSTVRSTAFNTLVSIYKHVGEKFRHDLQRKYSLPSNKLTPLMTAFDQLKGVDQICDQMDVAATISHDQTDKASVVAGKIYNGGGGGNTFNTPSSYKTMTTTKTTTTTLATPGSRKMLMPTPQAGAIDENIFVSAFEETTNWTSQQVYCGRDVEDFIKKAQEILSDSTQDWTKHVDALRSIRCLMNTGGMEYDEFYTSLKLMLPAFHTSVRDLRSQVVRETCITLAYLSKRLASRFDYFAISLMDPLINLIQNSAKVISSCALICIRFILRYTHSPRLITVLVNNLTSKSKDIRRACCEFVGIILLTWNVHTIEKQLSQLQNAIAKGVQDADPEARSFSRKAYATFAQHFPEQATALLLLLDNSYKKLLVPIAATTPVAAAATPSTTNNYYKTPPASASRYGKLPSRGANNNVNNNLTLRSSSAIDLNAVKRAKVRAEYAALSRQKVGTLSVAGNCSLPRSKKLAVTRAATIGKGIGIVERTGRTKVRMSISQPTSRSASPLSKFGYTSGGDESETSSISGFDQSYEYRRHPSDIMYSWNGSQHTLSPLKDTMISSDIIRGGDIASIISSCENTYWTDRKKGLISLQCYLEDGYKIPTMADLKRIVDMFAKIFNDPHTKVFAIVLDSFNALVITHHDELHFAVQILLTRLLNKFGTDLLSSVQAKILSTLDLLCNCFPPNLQLHCVCRFLTDPTQTPNTRVKIATLKYLLKLTEAEQPCLTLDYSSGSGSSDDVVVVINDRNKEHMIKAFEKLIGWTNLPDKELRKLAVRCLIAIFYQNIPLVTKLFSELPSNYQQMAANLIKTSNKNNYCNNYYYDNDTGASNTPDSSIAVSPPSSLSYKHYNCGSSSSDLAKFCGFDNNDDIITVDNNRTVTGGGSGRFSDTSCKENNNYYLSTSNDEPDTVMTRCDTILSSSNDCSDSSLKKYIDELSSSSNDANADQVWLKIDQIVRDGPSDVIVSNFKVLLRLILFTVSADSPKSSDSSSAAREMAINLLQSLVKRKSLLFCFNDFIELIILKVLKASRDNCKDVVKAAENCALTLSSCLPSDLVVRVIVPLIQADDYPLNLIAIKMITNIVQFAPNGKQPIVSNISHIMNSLLLAYENVESSVRKSAVFSIVALHKELGGQLITPYINTLHGAKLKLLQLYIAKAQQNNNNNTTNNNY